MEIADITKKLGEYRLVSKTSRGEGSGRFDDGLGGVTEDVEGSIGNPGAAKSNQHHPDVHALRVRFNVRDDFEILPVSALAPDVIGEAHLSVLPVDAEPKLC